MRSKPETIASVSINEYCFSKKQIQGDVKASQFKWTFDIDGKTTTVEENGVDFSGDSVSHGTMASVSTDGSTWVATAFTGDTFFSTDAGDTFTAGPTNVGSKDALDNAPDVYLPL